MFNFFNFISGIGFIPSTHRYEHKQYLMKKRYALFQDIQSSADFRHYEELRTYVTSPEYETALHAIKSLSYRNSKEYAIKKHYRKLKKRKEIKIYIKKGKEIDPLILEEFIPLREEIHSPAFKQRVAYLKNRKRHKQSEPYKKRQEYLQCKRSAKIKEFYRLQKKYTAAFEEMERWTILFEDHFSQKKPADHWNTKPFWSINYLHENYVQNDEKHKIDTHNVYIRDNILTITTEAANNNPGLAWDEQYGFVPRHFNYISGTLNTANHFLLKQKQGKIEVKLRAPAVKNVYHAFWLNHNEKTPAVSVFNICNHFIETGVYQNEYDDKSRRKIKLNPQHFQIIQIEWNEEKIIWQINGKTISRKPNTINIPLYLNIASGVVGKVPAHKLPVNFELDWIKISSATI